MLLASLAALIAPIAVTSPAHAAALTDAQTRDAFRAVALDQLDYVENHQLADGTITYSTNKSANEGIPAQVYAYTARLEAFRNGGDWTAPAVKTYIDKVLALKQATPNSRGQTGFLTGQGGQDRMGDGTVNDDQTILTVTQADHVGPMFLAAAKALPATYGPEVDFLVDSIMLEPVHTIQNAGSNPWQSDFCMAYDDNPNDADYCFPNVSIGAAAFLQRALDAGYHGTRQTTSDVQNMIAKLKPLATDMYAPAGQRGPDAGHWWPYAWDDATATFTRANVTTAQDWNHEAYTAESADYLGIAAGADSLTAHVGSAWYNPTYAYTGRSDGDAVTDIQGRLRMAYLRPNDNTRNLLLEAQWAEGVYTNQAKNASSRIQLGLWASRLAENATSTADLTFNVGSLAPATADDTSVPKGSKTVIRSTVYNNYGTPIVQKSLELHLAGAHTGQVGTAKKTGLRGNIGFTVTLPNTVTTKCYAVQSTNGTTSNRVCVSTY